jgi:peroxiredoxin
MLNKIKLHTGDNAPDFTIKDVNGSEFRLSRFKGEKSVVLVFLRYLGCPLCQIALQELKNTHHEFTACNTEVVAFIQSPLSTILESGDSSVFPFRLIPDPGELIYKKYGVGRGNLLMVPQSILKAYQY